MNEYKRSPEYASLPKSRQYLVDIMVETINSQTRWKKGWQVSMPPMSLSGHEYSGENSISLTLTALKRGYTDPRWLTFNQIRENGYRFKASEDGGGLGKGAGVKVSFYEMRDKKTKARFDRETLSGLSEKEREDYIQNFVYPVRKTYTVFNADIVDGVPPLPAAPGMKRTDGKSYPEAEKFLEFWQNNVCPVRYGGTEAAYDISIDRIRLPDRENFVSEEEFYSTAFHEISHSTQHLLRPGKRLSTDKSSPEYAKDEVEAEICSIFLGQKFCGGADLDIIRNSSAYIKMWLRRSDRIPALFSAISAAEEMYRFAGETYEAKKEYVRESPSESSDKSRPGEEKLECLPEIGTPERLSMPEEQKEEFDERLKWRPSKVSDAVPSDVREARLSYLEKEDAELLRPRITSECDRGLRFYYFGGDYVRGETGENAMSTLVKCAHVAKDASQAERLFMGSAYFGEGQARDWLKKNLSEAMEYAEKFRAGLNAAGRSSHPRKMGFHNYEK
ncbi:MAG: ssDNA-binding domain-containing protein [Clostridia bacterium]|nr:ssDNA-binding domain-containing protein [Clostridia bacterium]